MTNKQTRQAFRDWLHTPNARKALSAGDFVRVLSLAQEELGLRIATCMVCNADGTHTNPMEDPIGRPIRRICAACNGHGVVYRILQRV